MYTKSYQTLFWNFSCNSCTHTYTLTNRTHLLQWNQSHKDGEKCLENKLDLVTLYTFVCVCVCVELLFVGTWYRFCTWYVFEWDSSELWSPLAQIRYISIDQANQCDITNWVPLSAIEWNLIQWNGTTKNAKAKLYHFFLNFHYFSCTLQYRKYLVEKKKEKKTKCKKWKQKRKWFWVKQIASLFDGVGCDSSESNGSITYMP